MKQTKNERGKNGELESEKSPLMTNIRNSTIKNPLPVPTPPK